MTTLPVHNEYLSKENIVRLPEDYAPFLPPQFLSQTNQKILCQTFLQK